MAGCCSSGVCSSVKPIEIFAPILKQPESDNSSREASCDKDSSPALEDPQSEVERHNQLNATLPPDDEDSHAFVFESAANTTAAESPNFVKSIVLQSLPPSSSYRSAQCSNSCCDESGPSDQTIISNQREKTPAIKCSDTALRNLRAHFSSPAAIAPISPKIEHCSDVGGTCCVRKLPDQSDSELSQLQSSSDQKDASSYTVINMEGTTRLTIDVQGMTCVGCEKNLIKALNAIQGLANIKTSLLGCKADFDFQSTKQLPDPSMVMKEIERMTGFKCKRILDLGEELELILAPRYADMNLSLPHGVSLKYRGRDRVFVTFDPNSIGARDLLSHPSLSYAKLAPPRPSSSLHAGRAHLNNSIYMTILSVILTIPVLVLAYGEFPKHETLYGAVSLALATIIQTVVAGPFYTRAIRTLIFSRLIEMDMLVVLSTNTAYVYSVIAFGFMVRGQPLSTSSFFETSTLLVTIIMIGQTLGSYARQQAVESISIESLQTQTAVIVDMKTQLGQMIDARLLQYGDTFKVLADENVVTDGIIVQGETELDESMITGESNLVKRGPGSPVIAGSINHSGTILVQLTRLPSENTIKTISALVDEARSSKPKVQEIADVFAGYFTPAIVILTIIVFVFWVAIGKSLRHEKTSTACINAMTFAISTLIVSCPCAIGLAVPMVVVIACGVGARHGLILKSSSTIELGRRITHVVLDKTGTLTQGHPSVIHEQYFTAESSLLPVILGLTNNSKHPVSIAIAKHLEAKGIQPTHLSSITSIPGSGISGTHDGLQVCAGNQYWLNLSSYPSVQSLASTGSTLVCITLENELIALYGLSDQLRPEALSVLTSLKARGISVSLTSGDHFVAVSSVASQLNIPAENVLARCTPASKAEYIKTLQEASPNGKTKRKNTVLFIGDGTNDAIALAQADIGMHLSFLSSSLSPSSTSNSIASSAASTILLHPSLNGILTLIDLSHAFHRRVVFNFAWSLVYNIFAIALASGVFEGVGDGRVRIQPRYAGLGELVSVLPVIGIAVSLKCARF